MLRIIITGYMGSGKTTLGKVLATQLGVSFYDLDWYIEGCMRKTIEQLFAEYGEECFREIERNMLHEVAEFENIVLSCGGGTPCFFDNIDYMNSLGDTIYLKATPEVLYKHLQIRKTVRPLLSNKNKEDTLTFIEKQIKERESYYLKAKYTLDINLMDTYEKIQTYAQKIRKLLNR